MLKLPISVFVTEVCGHDDTWEAISVRRREEACLRGNKGIFLDYFIILCILGNSLSLAMFDYNDREITKDWNKALDFAGLVFTIIFTVECVLKIVAMGFVKHKQS